MPPIDLGLLRRLENAFFADFARVERRDYGLLYYQPDNPLSHDSNHAVILDLSADLAAAVGDIATFYQAQGLEPRLYSSFVAGDGALLRPHLERRGFAFREQPLRWFVLDDAPAPPDPRAAGGLEVRRVRVLTKGLRELIHSEGPVPWTEHVLRHHLPCEGLHLLVGYVDGLPVTMASLKEMDGLARVDDVLTHPFYRRRGYARALLAALVAYHRRLTPQPLYLYAEEPSAIRIYEGVGFVEQVLPVDQWSAWLPG